MIHAEHIPAEYNYDGKSCCEECMLRNYYLDVEDADERKRCSKEHEFAMKYFDKHKKWPGGTKK